jgi:Fe-S-cluster-containing dehydrogenase component/CRP-like cAMP-binding protein
VSDRWPAAVWDSAWLRGLDGRARAQIEAAGRVRSLARGDRVYAMGEPADTFFVVASGIVEVRAVRRGETQARPLRRAVAGDALGEHAVVRPGAPRTGDASCVTSAIVAEVPAALFRRAVARAGGPECPEQQALRRAAARETFRTSALARALSEADLEALVVATEHRELGRGDILFASGDPATHAYVVGDGMLRVGGDEEVGTRAAAYLTRGDPVTECVLEERTAHDVTVAACGPAWVLGIPRAVWMRVEGRARGALEGARRWTRAVPSRAEGPEAGRAMTGRSDHVRGDLWRFAEARSMLVIDDEACVRCGHCAWSCADAHADGVSRLVRRGAKVLVRDAADGAERALVVAGSCQHCKHPACMVDCPTGAIGRDLSGSVFIRDEICVGCGQCARACPWGSVQMAPRVASASGWGEPNADEARVAAERSEAKRAVPDEAPLPASRAPRASHAIASLSPLLAVKCDMCKGLAGPACVSACPADAIARIEPTAALIDVRLAVAVGSERRGLPERRAAWPWVTAAAIVSAAAAQVATSWGAAAGLRARWLTGGVAGALVLLLVAYAAVKRGRRRPTGTGRSRTRPYAIAHAAIGIVAVGTVMVHAGTRITPNVAGALLGAFALASATGVFGALAYWLVPRALSRLERTARLPEDLAARGRDLDEGVFVALSGRSDATKGAYARWLAPYARAPLGALALVARGVTLHDEERRLRARILQAGRGPAAMDGLDDLVRLVVERRALRAQRALQMLLRAWVPAHVVAVAVTAALFVVHVVCVVKGR